MHYIHTVYTTVIWIGIVVWETVIAIGITIRDLFYFFRNAFERVILTPILELIPKPIKPDHLSWLRVPLGVLVTIFLFLFPQRLVAVILYVVACATDILDGALARFRRQFSVWGGRIDPLADKVLNDLIFAGYTHSNEPGLAEMNSTFWIIVGADVILLVGTGLMAYFYTNKRIQANIFGKIKFFAQCAGGMMLMLGFVSLAKPVLETAALLGVASILSYSHEAWRGWKSQ